MMFVLVPHRSSYFLTQINGSTTDVTILTSDSQVGSLCGIGVSPALPLSGIVFDWLTDGAGGTGITFLGNESVSTPYYTNVIAQHWQSVGSCKDVWLIRE